MSRPKRGKSIYPFFNKRHDSETASIVEEGIRLLEKVGKEYAEAYLRFKGIKPEIIHRILNESTEKRRVNPDTEENKSN